MAPETLPKPQMRDHPLQRLFEDENSGFGDNGSQSIPNNNRPRLPYLSSPMLSENTMRLSGTWYPPTPSQAQIPMFQLPEFGPTGDMQPAMAMEPIFDLDQPMPASMLDLDLTSNASNFPSQGRTQVSAAFSIALVWSSSPPTREAESPALSHATSSTQRAKSPPPLRLPSPPPPQQQLAPPREPSPPPIRYPTPPPLRPLNLVDLMASYATVDVALEGHQQQYDPSVPPVRSLLIEIRSLF
ncbi:hypothetical protein CF326_g8452 [Tilletia indica]|nr:hypothetical protein CF326_g8452 [Tilletia indica]